MTTIPALAGIALFVMTLLWAAASDAYTLQIPNWIVIVLLAGYVLLAPLAGFPLRQMGMSAAAASVTCVILLLAYSRGWMGAGDAKLITAAALWLGADHVLAFLLWTSIFGGVLAFMVLGFRAIPLKTSGAVPSWIMHLHGRDGGIPLGLAIAASGVMQIFSSPWMLAAD